MQDPSSPNITASFGLGTRQKEKFREDSSKHGRITAGLTLSFTFTCYSVISEKIDGFACRRILLRWNTSVLWTRISRRVSNCPWPPKGIGIAILKKNVKNQANTEMLNKRRFVHAKNVVKDANYLTSCKCLLNNTFLVAPENLKVNQK